MGLTYIVILPKLLLKVGNILVGKKQKHIRLLHSTEQQALGEVKQKPNTTRNLPTSMKESHYGTHDWLKKL